MLFEGPVEMLFRCIGLGGAFGRGPVLEIVAGEVIGWGWD